MTLFLVLQQAVAAANARPRLRRTILPTEKHRTESPRFNKHFPHELSGICGHNKQFIALHDGLLVGLELLSCLRCPRQECVFDYADNIFNFSQVHTQSHQTKQLERRQHHGRGMYRYRLASSTKPVLSRGNSVFHFKSRDTYPRI